MVIPYIYVWVLRLNEEETGEPNGRLTDPKGKRKAYI